MMVNDTQQLSMLQMAENEAAELLQEAITTKNDSESLFEILSQYSECWKECGEVALEQELSELQELCAVYEDAIHELCTEKRDIGNAEWQLFKDWHNHFKHFLASPDELEPINSLILCLQNQVWVSPLMEEDAIMLREIFSINSDEDNIESNPSETEEGTTPSVDLDSTETNTEVLTVKPDFIKMIYDQFVFLAADFNHSLADLNESKIDNNDFKSSITEDLYQLENLAKASGTVHLSGLKEVVNFILYNMRSRRAADPDFSISQCNLLKASLPLIQSYLENTQEFENSQSLVSHLQSDEWTKSLNQNEADNILRLLSSIHIEDDTEAEAILKITAAAEDISLKLPANVNKELLDAMLNELPELTATFASTVQRIQQGGSRQDIQNIQRIAHTLKGAGNTVGITGIATLTHHLEDILDILVEHNILPNKSMNEMILQASDCLEGMTECLLGLSDQPPEHSLTVLQQVIDWAYLLKTEGIPEDGDFVVPEPSETVSVNEPVTTSEDEATSTAVAMTRISTTIVDDLFQLSGENGILSEQLKEHLNEINEEISFTRNLSWDLHLQVSELDKLVNIQSIASRHSSNTTNIEFDSLEMEQYNELHTCTSRLDEISADIREMTGSVEKRLLNLNNLLADQQGLQKENLEIIQHIRMVAVETIESRCQRIVRQTCRMTDKQVDLEFIGGKVLIDSEILNGLVDPLMHLLRNAIDHGIENPAERTASGKNETGIITLTFERKGNYLSLHCSDDGAGLNYAKIRESAIKKGLVTEDQELSNNELNRIILTPGFSTRDVVTQVSGRGIGMDAIQSQISQIKGSMLINSEIGRGLIVELNIPLSLSSIQILLARSEQRVAGIPTHNIEQVLHANDGSILQTESGFMFLYDENTYPVQNLRALLALPLSSNTNLPVVLVQDETGETKAVLVDELLGNREAMVKGMGAYMPNIPGITGATILGNGSVAPIIDVIELLRETGNQSVLNILQSDEEELMNRLPTALVVDDSLSARRALAQLLQDSGFKVNTAIDGLDAIEQIEKELPDVLLVDLEMPRMNGIELTTHVRNRKDIADVPIIMVTSRSTDKHRKQAEMSGISKYFIKPFSEDELLKYVHDALDSADINSLINQ
ncbi:MAG: response regulator [Methylococcales bacterium]|nr:response regulator [Methylococcales bacterium]